MTVESSSAPRDEVTRIVNAAAAHLTPAAVFARAQLVEDMPQLTRLLFSLSNAGEISKHPAPEGSGTGVRYVYGPAGAKAATAPVRAARRPKRTGGFMARKRARNAARTKSQPSAATAAAKDRKHVATLVPVRIAAAEHPPVHRWALTNDGAFLLLGSPVEIRGGAARALVDFVRTLDKAQA